MREVPCIRLGIGLPVCVAAWLLASAEPALAHKMHLFAKSEAETVRGRVYFSGGTPAQDVTVEAFDPTGQKVAEARTDAQGEFTLAAGLEGELKLIATTDDGHAAEPFALTVGDQIEQPSIVEVAPNGPQAEPSTLAAPDRKALEAAVEAAVRREVAPLEKRLTEIQDRITFRDYVGGIGYIMGLMGLVFYFLGVRRRASRGAASAARSPAGGRPPAEAGTLESPEG